MACTKPLIRVVFRNIQVKGKNGKINQKAKIFPNSYYENLYEKYKENENVEIMKIPCGKCTSCRLDKAKEWATRIELESKEYDSNWFLTLTYNDENLPKDGNLKKEHLQKFIKDIRSYYKYHYNKDNIRFFGCGEYGSDENTKRPHYHVIMLNLDIDIKELEFYKLNKLKEPLYKCKKLEKIWGKGYVIAGAVTWQSASYVARYTTKKIGKDKKYYEENKITPEFVTMSRRPGIGINYYKENKEKIYKYDEIVCKSHAGNIASRKVPRYFNKKYEEEHPNEYEEIRKKRIEKSKLMDQNQKKNTDYSTKEILDINDRTIERRTSSLKRD